MALFRRLLILGAAGAGAAYFLKQQRESGGEPVFGGDSASTGGATTTDIGDDAAAGTGTAETLQEAGASEPEPTVAREIPSTQPTRVGNPVMPDTSADPLVREQENAAAAEAGSIGGTPETPQSSDQVGLAQDPAMKPVVEAAGEEHETLEDTDRDLGAGRERPA